MKEDALPEDELIAQLSCVRLLQQFSKPPDDLSRILLFAATDTTSTALTLILECLAKNTQAQDKLRAEIIDAKRRHEGDDIPYDELMSLPYLDAVCSETLRV